MPYLTRPNAKLFYTIEGEGQSLILINGLAGDQTIWGRFAELLKQRYQLILLDNRGAGRTEYEGEFTLQDMVDDVHALIHHLALDQVNVLGHSMGGYIAQHLAAQYPNHIHQLILMSTRPYASSVSRLAYQNLLEFIETGVNAETIIKSNMTTLFGERYLDDPARVKFRIEASLNRQYSTAVAGLRIQMKVIDSFNGLPVMPNIAAKTLILHGDEDRVSPMPYAETMAKLIPDAQIHWLNGVGHMPYIEMTDEAAEAISDFLG